MRHKGRITTWHDDRGFGFLTPMAGGDRVFVHIQAFGRGAQRPNEGDLVVYTLGKDKQGRVRAATAKPADLAPAASKAKPARKARRLPAGRIAVGFLLLMAILVVAMSAPLIIIVAYLVLSLVSYILYAWDKGSARRGTWRTPETTLHLVDLLGGWPGGLLAQQSLRHKTIKSSFQTVFWGTVVINGVGFALLLTPAGKELLGQLVVDSLDSLQAYGQPGPTTAIVMLSSGMVMVTGHKATGGHADQSVQQLSTRGTDK